MQEARRNRLRKLVYTQVTPLHEYRNEETVFVSLIVWKFVGYSKSGSIEYHSLITFHGSDAQNADTLYQNPFLIRMSKRLTLLEEKRW